MAREEWGSSPVAVKEGQSTAEGRRGDAQEHGLGHHLAP